MAPPELSAVDQFAAYQSKFEGASDMTPEQRKMYDGYLQKALVEYEWTHPYQTGEKIADAGLMLGMVALTVNTVTTTR